MGKVLILRPPLPLSLCVDEVVLVLAAAELFDRSFLQEVRTDLLDWLELLDAIISVLTGDSSEFAFLNNGSAP